LLTHPMLDQLTQLGLSGMAQASTELETSAEGTTLTHADWLGLLVDREVTHRRDKRLAARLRYARLRPHAIAIVEDVDYRAPRGLDRALFHQLVGGEWIDAHDNLILCGPTGVGKIGLPVPSATRPAATTVRFFISVFPSSLPISPWRAATAAMPACAASMAFSFSSS
jgi:DNA replication protein DnaC